MGGLGREVRSNDDQDAANELVAYLYPAVAKVLHRRLPAQVGLEDVAQQVFLKVFSKLHQFRGDVPLENWVTKIAVNTCLNAMRGERLRREVRRADLSENECAVIDEVRSVDSSASAERLVAARELLQKLLQCLSPKERLAFELTEAEGHTSEEAAKLLGSTAIAVRVRVTRAKAKMRKHLQTLNQKEPS